MTDLIKIKNTKWAPHTEGKFFTEFKRHYKDVLKRPEEDYEDTINKTIEILSKSIDPYKDANYQKPSRLTGLVIGDIQSGKTSSMLSLCHLARDNKFKIIIILSGNVSNLASQTAKRFSNSEKSSDHQSQGLRIKSGWRILKGVGTENRIDKSDKNKILAALKSWDDNTYDEDEKKNNSN